VDPDAAARVARERGACIRAVAVGSGGPAQVEVRLPSGRVEYRTKEYPADRETLRRVADLSGGSFMDAPDAASLARAMSQIARPEPAPAARSRCVAVSPLGWAFALAGGGLSAAAHALACTALRSGPELA
jgi:Ca-activated chloride channel family protein